VEGGGWRKERREGSCFDLFFSYLTWGIPLFFLDYRISFEETTGVGGVVWKIRG